MLSQLISVIFQPFVSSQAASYRQIIIFCCTDQGFQEIMQLLTLLLKEYQVHTLQSPYRLLLEWSVVAQIIGYLKYLAVRSYFFTYYLRKSTSELFHPIQRKNRSIYGDELPQHNIRKDLLFLLFKVKLNGCFRSFIEFLDPHTWLFQTFSNHSVEITNTL